MAAIVEASEDPIIGKDLTGTVFAWNGAAERLFGYTAEEMIGKPVTIIFPPDRVQEEGHILARVARGERVEQYETSRRHKDGRLIRIAATVSPIRDESGRIIGASKIVRDLTQRDAQEERIQQLQTELAHVQRLTELGQVVSALVHEVNQPITAIKNYLGACRRLAASGNQTALQSALRKIEKETNRTSAVIQRIRDFVKRRDIRIQPETLSNVIQEAVELTRSSIRDDTTALTVQVDATERRVEIDRVQVQQVLFNLMRNSVEAMQDQPRRELRVATRNAEDDMVEISVADTGPGLPEKVREQLFQPFVTTKPSGMGVGLSVCQGIVQLHGGRLWAEDNVGGGTVFRFTVRGAGNPPSGVAG